MRRWLFVGLLALSCRKPMPRLEVRLTVTTSPQTLVFIEPPADAGRPRVFLGPTPVAEAPGAFVGDFVVMTNADAGLEYREQIPYSEPGSVVLIERIFSAK